MVATLKPYRVGLVGLIVGASMLFSSSNAFAEQALTTITCADPQGNERQFQIGWDNSNQFFEGKGDIPRLFCEGGYAQPYTTYIADTLPADSPLRWYAGIAPTPEPTPSPSVTIEPTPMPTAEPEPSLTPSLAPSPVPTPIAPSLAPVVPVEPPTAPTPTQTPEPEPTPPPEPPTPETSPPALASPPPTIEPSPPALAPEPPPAPPIVIELPPLLADIPGAAQVIAAAEAILNVGNDMTPEQREESQQVAVAAVLVTQIASSVRRVK